MYLNFYGNWREQPSWVIISLLGVNNYATPNTRPKPGAFFWVVATLWIWHFRVPISTTCRKGSVFLKVFREMALLSLGYLRSRKEQRYWDKVGSQWTFDCVLPVVTCVISLTPMYHKLIYFYKMTVKVRSLLKKGKNNYDKTFLIIRRIQNRNGIWNSLKKPLKMTGNQEEQCTGRVCLTGLSYVSE